MRRLLLLSASLATLAVWTAACAPEKKEEDEGIVSVTVGPGATIEVGETAQLTVTGTLSDDTTDDVTDVANFTTATSAIATVSDSGLVTGVGAGTVTITASVGFRTGSTLITVVPTGGGTLFTELEPNDDPANANAINDEALTFEGSCSDVDDPVDLYTATVTSGTFTVSVAWLEAVTAPDDPDLDLALYDIGTALLGTGDALVPPGDSPAEQTFDLAPGTYYIEVYCFLATVPADYVGTITRP